MMLRLVPNIFYEKLSDGLDLFVTCLGFSVLYQDDQLAVVSRDGAKAYLVESTSLRLRTVRKSQWRPTRSRTCWRKCPYERRTIFTPGQIRSN
jgi:hypothetical protein